MSNGFPSTTISSMATGGGSRLLRIRAGSTMATPFSVLNHKRPSLDRALSGAGHHRTGRKPLAIALAIRRELEVSRRPVGRLIQAGEAQPRQTLRGHEPQPVMVVFNDSAYASLRHALTCSPGSPDAVSEAAEPIFGADPYGPGSILGDGLDQRHPPSRPRW